MVIITNKQILCYVFILTILLTKILSFTTLTATQPKVAYIDNRVLHAKKFNYTWIISSQYGFVPLTLHLLFFWSTSEKKSRKHWQVTFTCIWKTTRNQIIKVHYFTCINLVSNLSNFEFVVTKEFFKSCFV